MEVGYFRHLPQLWHSFRGKLDSSRQKMQQERGKKSIISRPLGNKVTTFVDQVVRGLISVYFEHPIALAYVQLLF